LCRAGAWEWRRFEISTGLECSLLLHNLLALGLEVADLLLLLTCTDDVTIHTATAATAELCTAEAATKLRWRIA
ncbi:hypothetical protein, partial [Halalkalibacter flavus]|uniref:hypothetical protein n=1 Tax=Halalkalibacter flavus TaxID=3090668 RepID=UPI002FC8E13C